MKRRMHGRFEPLEGRYCLAVAAAVDHGNLVISGDADGAVEITAVDATTLNVAAHRLENLIHDRQQLPASGSTVVSSG